MSVLAEGYERRKPYLKAFAALGDAVHPAALRRLFEMWPEARVHVQHAYVWRGKPFTSERIQVRQTLVRIEAQDFEPNERTWKRVTRTAMCSPDDQYDRKYGIALAFRRALHEVSNRYKRLENPEG